MTYFGIYRWMKLRKTTEVDKEILDLELSKNEIENEVDLVTTMEPDIK